jgi:hypothetical protein
LNTREEVQEENVTNFLANQPQIDITLLEELVTIGAEVPTTPKGGNHGHTNTITPQSIKKPIKHSGIKGRKLQENPKDPKTKGGSHHHTATNQNTIKHSKIKGGELQSSDQQHPKTKGGNL